MESVALPRDEGANVCPALAESGELFPELSYDEFLRSKHLSAQPVGFNVAPDVLNSMLFSFQRDIVRWGLKRGRCAFFEDCGLGKTPQQLEWGRHVHRHTAGNILIAAPLAVAEQTRQEGEKFSIPVTICRRQSDVQAGINVTNYEMLEHFKPGEFSGIILDESSRLKHVDSKTRGLVIEMFARTPYRLACTATPAPNDHMELGNHAEFLGVMTRAEMLAMFFVHDGGETQKWRLKGHAEHAFWQWVASWAVTLRTPSDLGYDDGAFHLPSLHVRPRVVKSAPDATHLFAAGAVGLNEQRQARKNSLSRRVQLVAHTVNRSKEPWIVWCDLNAEGDALAALIPDAVQVAGSDTPEHKIRAVADFTSGKTRVIVSKPSMFGFGLNLQTCSNMAFVGMSNSFESYYQAVRRCWRFGQTRPVHVHVVTSEAEGEVVKNIERKQSDAERMAAAMVEHTKAINTQEIHGTVRDTASYLRVARHGDGWTAHMGDCVEVVRELESDSVGYSIYSPPFRDLYTYSNSERDMGNCKGNAEFFAHFQFLASDLLRVLMPGRLMSFHCMNLPTSKQRDGFIGISDFRGDLIRIFQVAGFIYHSEVVIWKDPVTAMQRTKALGLLHKTIRKDSAMSRQGIPDYLVTMRKPGENPRPIAHTSEEFPVSLWQRYASPVWFDINPSRTLSREEAREQADERHICALQLDVIERALELWTARDDLVLSPFMGIGSEGYCALKMGRRFVGAELKPSYWEQACLNLARAESERSQRTIFDFIEEAA